MILMRISSSDGSFALLLDGGNVKRIACRKEYLESFC